MKITILTVCYNNQETILATLNSVLNQTYKNIEHIIVDGKSTDKTKIFLKKYHLLEITSGLLQLATVISSA